MRAKLAVVVTVLVAAYVVVAAQQTPFVGRWNLTGTGSDNHLIHFLEVKQVGDHLEGMFLNRTAHAQPIPIIKVENGELTWQFGPGDTLPKPACGPVYHAKIENGKLIGHHETPGDPCPSARGGRAGEGAAASAPATTPAAPPAPPRAAPAPRTVNWVGVRQPAWPPSNANGNHTYGPPIVLFDGKSLDAFGVQNVNSPMKWSVADGAMF